MHDPYSMIEVFFTTITAPSTTILKQRRTSIGRQISGKRKDNNNRGRDKSNQITNIAKILFRNV